VGSPLRELPMSDAPLFALGAERTGLPSQIVAACDHVAHIPVGEPGSLNVAMTATLCLYEYSRRAQQARST
jgi:TrmH family RNA methyltransferase